MSRITIIPYSKKYEQKWDDFVLNYSANGTFLQTRRFLNYHPEERFMDASFIILNGNELFGVVPANCVYTNNKKQLISHQGSTFGGIIIKNENMKIRFMSELLNIIEDYCRSFNYERIVFKQPGRIYCKEDMDLLEYFFYNKGYCSNLELGFYIDFNAYSDDIISNYTSSRRRDYKYSLKNMFSFSILNSSDEIIRFHSVLVDNYKKFGKSPVHTSDELIDLFENRISKNISFFGVYEKDELVAGAMVFLFDKRVFHTQYLAVRQDVKDRYINEFLYTNLICYAKESHYRYLSFGTSTFDMGRILNDNLAQFKEGFGTKEYNNITYIKDIV